MNRVKQERRKKGWSQLELAMKTKINQSDISQIENSKIYPYPGWRKKLAEALGADEEFLFPDIKKKKEKNHQEEVV
ncbi:MAG: helix-turn-helix domain-containing protein [bacterium]